MEHSSVQGTAVGASLRQKTIRGLKFASLGTAGKTLVDIGINLVLIRVLAPEMFGIFAVAQALTGFMSCFSDFAGLKFLVRFKEQSGEVLRRAVSSVFWFELLMGVAVAIAWVVISVPVFHLLDDPTQIPYAQALAIWILAERLMLPRSIMDRDLRFAQINIALFSGVCAAGVCMIAMAFLGYGAWVFIAGLILRTLISAGLMWHYSKFRLAFCFDRSLLRKLLFFGAPLMFTTALTFAYTNIDYVIVEYFLGKNAAGIYYNAYRYPHYLIQFNMILGSVAFPAFTKATSTEQFARGLGLITRYAGCIGFAAIIAMWIEGHALVNVLLGDPEKWSGAVFPFQVFATLAGLRLTYTHWGHWFVIKGNTKPLLYAAIWNLPVLTITTILSTKYFGMNGAAIAVSVVSLLTIFFCCFVWLKGELEFSYLKALKPVLIASAVTVPLMLCLKLITPNGDWIGVGRCFLGMIVYGGVLYVQIGQEALRLIRNRK